MVRFSVGAVTKIRSPSRSTKSPPGVTALPPRSTAHTSTRHLTMPDISASGILHSLLPGSMRSSTICTLPLAKVSRRRKPGNFSSRSISTAACCSGFTAIDRAKIFCMEKICSLYSGLRMRAMVCSFGLMPWAVVQQSRFTSSAFVTAISRSASRTPACWSTSIAAQLPWMTRTSSRTPVSFSTCGSESIRVMSYPSAESCRARVEPTLPSPAMMMFIMTSRPASRR